MVESSERGYASLGTQLDPSFSNALVGRFWLGFDHLATNLVRMLKPELRGISQAKGERVRSTWIPTTSLVISALCVEQASRAHMKIWKACMKKKDRSEQRRWLR
jgi:hypothetical protein